MKRVLSVSFFISIFFVVCTVSTIRAATTSCETYNPTNPKIGQTCGPHGVGEVFSCGNGNAGTCFCGNFADTCGKGIPAITDIQFPSCTGACYGYSTQTFPAGTTCWGKTETTSCFRCIRETGRFEPQQNKAVCGTPPGSSTTPGQPAPAPGAPSAGSCDGCMDEGSCNMRKGSWAKQTTGTCAPQGGYCSGTTFCGGGSSSTPAPLNRACGEKCSSNSDCRNPSGNGSPVACVNGTCQNTMCPAGQTIPGGNCSCGSNTRKCGQTCNGTVGLCGPGQGSCTYVNSPQHWYTGQPDCAWGSSTYCANSKNGYSTPVCITGDTPGGRYLVAPNGATRGITVEQMKASCQVCGNGEVEIGEECDLGANNGKSGFDCTANTCKKVSCNKVCATSADCGAVQHTVKLVALSRTSTSDILIDYVLDGTTYADTTPTLLPAGGLWTTVTSTDAHGGSYLRTAANGANVTYKTYSSSIVLHTQGGSARGSIAVYVDNVLKTTISNLTTQTGWVDVPVLVSLANQYTCYGAGTAKTCRLSANPSDSACTPPPPTATPVPTPVALVCSMPVSFTSTGNKAAWKIGDKITFTVGSVAAASLPTGSTIRYEGQVNAYRGTKQAYAATLSPINATASQFAPITIEAVNATYYFRFRYCLKNSQSVESCSAWGAWGSPIGN